VRWALPWGAHHTDTDFDWARGDRAVIIVSLFLISVAVVLLLFGLREPSTVLLSASIGTSLLAALVSVISARRPAGGHDEFAMEWQPRHAGDTSRAVAASSEETMRLLNLASGAPERRAPAEQAVPVGTAADAARTRGAPGWRRTEDAGLSYPGIGGLSETARSGAATLSAEAGTTPDDTSPMDTSIPQQTGLTVEIADDVSDPDVRLTEGGDDVGDHEAAGGRAAADDHAVAEELYLADEPTAQQVSSADAARVSQLSTEVLVVDGRPRYHLSGCVHLLGRDSEPLPVSEAVELGFTPCGLCEPDSALLAEARRV
jgi:hypothetical protein